MKALNALVLPLIAAAGLCMAADSQAQNRHGGSPGYRGGGHTGVSGGHWHGGGPRVSYGYGYRHGHYYGGHAYWGWWGAAIAAPFLWGGVYYDWPYYGPYAGAYWGPRYYRYGPGPYYPDEVAYGYPQASNEVALPTTEVPASGPGAPTQRPLYMNYCEDTKAYYPKVGSCASGWQMRRPQYN